jgi:hypothetical protein
LFCSPGFWDVGGLLRALSSKVVQILPAAQTTRTRQQRQKQSKGGYFVFVWRVGT